MAENKKLYSQVVQSGLEEKGAAQAAQVPTGEKTGRPEASGEDSTHASAPIDSVGVLLRSNKHFYGKQMHSTLNQERSRHARKKSEKEEVSLGFASEAKIEKIQTDKETITRQMDALPQPERPAAGTGPSSKAEVEQAALWRANEVGYLKDASHQRNLKTSTTQQLSEETPSNHLHYPQNEDDMQTTTIFDPGALGLPSIAEPLLLDQRQPLEINSRSASDDFETGRHSGFLKMLDKTREGIEKFGVRRRTTDDYLGPF